jgi:hypothetical protein
MIDQTMVSPSVGRKRINKNRSALKASAMRLAPLFAIQKWCSLGQNERRQRDGAGGRL